MDRQHVERRDDHRLLRGRVKVAVAVADRAMAQADASADETVARAYPELAADARSLACRLAAARRIRPGVLR